MIELFVEGYRADINTGFSTMLTMAIDDIKDFGAKNGTYSKTIILPGTKNNNILFGNIFEISSGTTYNPSSANVNYNFNAAIGAKAYIFADNIQIFKGIIRIMEIMIDNGVCEYECVVFGELGGFVAKVGNKKLEELDFSAYNHTYSLANITGSWTNVSGAGYKYPLIDYGTYGPWKHDWDVRTFRPAFFAKEYIDKIFSDAGYSYVSDLFNTARFKTIVVPHNMKALTKNTSDVLRLSNHTTYTVLDAGGFDNVFGWTSFTGPLFTQQNVNQRYRYNGTANMTMVTNISMTGTLRGSGITFLIVILKNGAYVPGSIQYYSGGATVDRWVYSWSGNIDLPTNDYIEVYVRASSSLGSIDFLHLDNATLTGDSTIPVTTNINLGDAIEANLTIPKNILQKDFVSSIVKLFNLYIFEDYSNDKILNIKPFVDFYELATTIDWTNKVDRASPMKITPMSELNSRYFEFNFKDDSDFFNDLYKKRYNETYGSYKYDSEFEFAHEVTKVDLIFSGTPLVGYTGEEKVYPTIFKRSGNIQGAGEECIDSNIRLLQTKYVTGVASWNITDNDTVIGTYTAYPYAGHFDDPDAPANDLQFGTPKELFFVLAGGSININQFNVYWASYMAEITDKDSRLLSVKLRLSYKDIYQLDFSKLYYIDGVLYRLNSIQDFNASQPDLCKATFLKVINRIY